MEIYVMHDGQQLGPFSLENVRAQLVSGELSAADYAWGIGIDDLTSLSDLMSDPLQPLTGDDGRQKQKLGERLRTALRLLPDLVERQLTAKSLLAGTLLLLIASWIYPPWIVNVRSHAWFFVFDTSQNLEMHVDFGRLFLIDAIIAAAGGLLTWAAFHNWTPLRVTVRLAVYSLLGASFIGVIGLATFFIRDRITNRPTLNPLAYIGAIPVAGPGSQKGEYDVLINALGTPRAQVESRPVDRSVVSPADLKKITLFDVGVHGYKYSISGIYGRVRNGLANAVHKIGVKALFYSAEGELIEVRTFLMKHRAGASREDGILPNTPVSFDEHLSVDHLPDGYTWQLEVAEAQYVN